MTRLDKLMLMLLVNNLDTTELADMEEFYN